MGTLNVDRWAIEFDDRTLTHLQVVVINRFRRGEAVLVSWIDSVNVGSGRSSVWLTPTTTVYFRFAGSRLPALDRDWIHLLAESASSPTGLIVMDEHGVPVRAGASATHLRLPPSAVPRTHRAPSSERSDSVSSLS